MPTLAGWAEVVILSFLGLFLFPTIILEKDPAMADQFLNGETMSVHCYCLPIEELVHHGWILLQEEGGE